MIGVLALGASVDGVSDPPTNALEWFTHRSSRAISGPIPERLWPTVWHSSVALLVVIAIAVPLGAVLAHRRQGERLASFLVSIGRAVPTITIVGLAVIVSLRNGYGFEPWPILVALVLLGLPPVFANTYAAVRNVDDSPVDSARAMGSTELQVLLRVELPLALPVVLAGVRTAAVQIVATEPLGAFFGGKGLGFYLSQGLAIRDNSQVQAGALLVGAAAMGTELALILISRLLVPDGIRRAGRSRRTASRRRPSDARPATSDTLPETARL